MNNKHIFLPYLLTGSAIAAVILGFGGFLHEELKSSEPLKAIHAALQMTLQLFVLSVDAEDMSNWFVRVAGVLAPLATAGATLAAFRKEALLRWRITRLRFDPPTHLYLGGGRAASAIYTAMRSKPGPHVGIELHDESYLAEALEQHRANGFVIQGDSTSEYRLSAFPLDRIKTIFVTLGDDKRNLDALKALVEIRDTSKGVRAPATGACESRWFVDISNHDLARLVPSIVKEPPRVEIEFFSIEALVSRHLMQDLHRTILPKLLSVSKADRLHLCIIGSGRFSEALILQSLRQLVTSEDPDRCLTLTWFGPDAQRSLEKFYLVMPFLDPSCPKGSPFARLHPIARIQAVDADEGDVSLSQWEHYQRELPFSAIYVNGADRYDTLRGLNRAVALRDAFPKGEQVITTVDWDPPKQSAVVTEQDNLTEFKDVRQVHALDQIARDSKDYPGDGMDTIAKAVHDEFSAEEWDKTAQSNRWSSRMAADHLLVKKALLANLGANETNGKPLVITDPIVDLLARLEHRRFIVERLIDGWIPIPRESCDCQHTAICAFDSSSTKTGMPTNVSPPSGLRYVDQKNLLNLSKSLIPFEDLCFTEQESNRNSIRQTLKLLVDKT